MRPFDVESAPLAGVNLVEASAGTGKTWSLARLVVRLVAERRTEVSRILVVTFTEAATEELRVKVRNALTAALADAADAEAAAFLREAVSAFDQAAIHTIHAFCRRVLQDSAFESGALFDGELITDQAALVQEAVDDFWRGRAETLTPLYLPYLRAAGVNPDSLADLVTRHGARAGMRILPERKAARPSKAEQAFEEALGRFREAWHAEAAQAEAFLLEGPALARNRYPLRSMSGLVDQVRTLLAVDPGPDLFKGFAKLAAGEIREALKKGYGAVVLPQAFERAEELAAAAKTLGEGYRGLTAALRAEALRFSRERLRQRKAALGVSYFDDLLLDVHRALAGRGGRALVQSVRARYDAALVDEAQDTDPVQFEIFRRIFGDGSAPLFLIGDPKQAIYAFRGADVYAYLAARGSTESRFTLDTNRRSREPLVRAVNALFRARPRPFLAEEIEYLPARAAREAGAGSLDDLPALSAWMVRRGDGRRPSKEAARESVAEAVAGDIVRLIDGGRAGAGDVAVLVRSHRQAAEVQEHLRARGIPSVRNVSENPFASEEAEQLQRVLAAVIEPGRDPVLRAAVSTHLVGLTGEEIDALADAGWEAWAGRFAEYADVWARRGFYPMFRLLMEREKVTVRLLRLADGELRLAHLGQLAEKLHETAVRERLGMEALLKRLADMRLHPPENPQEAASRMETDAEAVQIVTIHLAKGREWPMVYCPFLWDLPQHPDGEAVVCHEEGELVLDLGTPEIEGRRGRAQEEALAEELRLLYVALTRARERLVISWGAVKSAERSALGYLLHPAADGGADKLDGVGDHQIRERLERLARESAGAISVEELPDPGSGHLRKPAARPEALSARSFAGAIDGAFRITSFTALARVSGAARAAAGAADQGADRDEEPGLAGLLAAPRPVQAPGPGGQVDAGPPVFLDFPRGTRPGTFVHAVLERLDFARAQEAGDDVRRALRDFGYSESWLPALLDLCGKAAALPVGGGRLVDAGPGETIREVPFTFPLRLTSPRAVAALMRVPEERFSSTPVRGFLRGYMDLVVRLEGRFWLVDWKSNHLGPDPADYSREALAAVMEAELYTLQYRLYCLALHCMLRLRLPDYDYETHFGGVVYAFLRGLDCEGAGVHAARPDRAEVERLERELVDA